MLDTELPLVVLDPNADFVRLGEPTDGAAEEDVRRLTETRFDVLRARADDESRPRCASGSGTLSTAAKASVLHLDPLADREEYNALLDGAEQLRAQRHGRPRRPAASDRPGLDPAGSADAQPRHARLGGLGVERPPRSPTASRTGARVTVLDLSGFEQAASGSSSRCTC